MEEVAQNHDSDEKVTRILEDETLSDMDKIKTLYQMGFNRKQLIEELGFSRSLVYRTLPVKPDKKGNEVQERFMPVTVKGTEVVTPEFIMQRLADGNNDWQLRLEGMMLLRAAQKMVREDVEIMKGQAEADAKLIEPVLKVMQEARAEQDAAAERAKQSSAGMAQEAAARAAAGVGAQIMPEVEAIKTQIMAKGENPMASMMMTLMMPSMQQAAQQLAGLFTKTQPGGGQPQPGTQPQAGQEQGNIQQQQQPWSSPNIEEHSIGEWEG